MTQWDETADLVIVGSGGGSMCAGLYARRQGKRVLILEKQALVGGSTAKSGGVIWVPNNPLMARDGVPDSEAQARTYFDAVVDGNGGPSTSPARRDAFLTEGPRMISFLESCGVTFVRAEGYPDYYDERPGGSPRGRGVAGKILDSKAVGEWLDRLNHFEGWVVPIYCHEVFPLGLMGRSLPSKVALARTSMRVLRQSLTGRPLLGTGRALQGRMLIAALAHGVEFWTDCPVERFVVEEGRVVGVVVKRAGETLNIGARDGVLINAGGFSRNLTMRQKYQPHPTSIKRTNANLGDTGEMIEAAMALGAATDMMDEAIWLLGSMMPDGSEEGTLFFTHNSDLAKPNCMLVDSGGTRYVDEAMSYMEIGRTMYRRHQSVSAIPSWAIFDARHRRRYMWGSAMPGKTPPDWIESGYMKTAPTIGELASHCGIPAGALEASIARFNGFAATGKDEDFHKGERTYDLIQGDSTVGPNPCLGPIAEPPFYAVQIVPADVGTMGGLVCDEHARVLRSDGTVIAGLYATGNSTASVTGRTYPGPGTSVANSFVFAYIAAKHALSNSVAEGVAQRGMHGAQARG